MKQSLQFGKTRSPLLVCFGAASSSLLRAIAFLLIAKICLMCAVAQVTPVPPFAGTHSETWERFNIAEIPSGTSLLGGLRTISGDRMETAHSCQVCGVIAIPTDGTF